MNHLTLLEQGIESWNQWRASHPNEPCNLAEQDLSHGYFFEGNFSGVDLSGANLQRACLVGANFQGADLSNADLTGAYLDDANFYGANLRNANLTKATLERADMRRANLLGTQLLEVDIRDARLPDPEVEPFVLASKPLTSQPLTNPIKVPAGAKVAVSAIATPDAKRPSQAKRPWLNRVVGQLQNLVPESPEAFASRQQSIRQSSMPINQRLTREKSLNQKPAAQRPATKAIADPAPAVSAQVANRANKIKKADKIKTARMKADTDIRTGAVSPPARRPPLRQWGRRQGDNQLAAMASYYMSRRAVWMPTMAAAGLALVVGLPLVTNGLGGGGLQASVVQSATSMALAKSLTSSTQIWTVASHSEVDGSTVVIGGDARGDIEIWDSETGETLQTLQGHTSGVYALAVSSSGQRLVSSSQESLKVWNPNTGVLIHSLPVETSTVSSVAIAPNESTFISSDRDGTLTAWDMNSGTALYSIDNGSAVWSVAIAPDGKSFVTGSSDRTVRQWDIATGTLLQAFVGHSDAVRSVAISPDGQTLASGSWDQSIKLWNLATGDLQTTLEGHSDQIFSLAISPDGQTLASSSTDKTLRLWDLASRQLTETLDNDTDSVVTVAFAATDIAPTAGQQPLRQTLVSGGRSQTVQVWQSGQP